ncbi:MAG: glutathione peroxidase [Chitinophagia bacterium]|nr:glutathione peroxidase [Chitinophagia bacterium]
MLGHFLLLFSFLFMPKSDVPQSIYDFKMEALDGGTINFAKYKGKKILIVNTASRCGYTPQYEGLEKLSKKYKDKLVIIGFPANNFGAQEPGTNSDIKEFCTKNYGVSFPMAAKISVKGDNIAPLYLWLTKKKYNNKMDSEVKWNFQKYLINEKGELVDVFMSSVTPDDKELAAAIEK